MIRFVVALIASVPVTVWYGTRMIWAAYTNAPDIASACDAGYRGWSRAMLRASAVEVEIEGAQHIDPDVPQVIVANHSSWFDVPVLAGFCPGPFVFVAKKEVERIPLFGHATTACGTIFIDRGDRALAVESLKTARKRLEDDGPSVIMFPEGTRSATGDLQPFKKGAFILAIETGTEVVPTAIVGSRDVMRKGSFSIRPGTIRVRFGTPIPVDSYDFERRDELTDRAWQALSDLLASDVQA